MAQKIPPPPPIAARDPGFNRWLLELTSILNGSGGIDPATIAGLIALQNTVATLQSQVTALQNTDNTQSANINALIANVNALLANPIVRNGTGAPAGTLGNNGDLYINNGGAAGSRLYAKESGAWVAIA